MCRQIERMPLVAACRTLGLRESRAAVSSSRPSGARSRRQPMAAISSICSTPWSRSTAAASAAGVPGRNLTSTCPAANRRPSGACAGASAGPAAAARPPDPAKPITARQARATQNAARGRAERRSGLDAGRDEGSCGMRLLYTPPQAGARGRGCWGRSVGAALVAARGMGARARSVWSAARQRRFRPVARANGTPRHKNSLPVVTPSAEPHRT